MSCDFQRSMCYFCPSYKYDISRRYQGNILETYYDAWNHFQYINYISIIRSCEQEIIKLDKIELQHSLQQFCIIPNVIHYYTSKKIACVLFHLINVFCTPDQEEKMRVVQVKLNEVLHTMTEEERCDIIERCISQRLKDKSSLTEMLSGQIDLQHGCQFKLFYWDIFYSKNGNEGCKEFLKKNADFLVSNIEGMATNLGFMWHIKLQLIACNILLCLLNWNICKTQKPVILQKDMEKPVPSSVSLVADPSTNYSFTNRASNMLQKILSTLSEKEIFKAFNDYFEQIYAMNSEITEDDLCIGMIEPYNEFLLKLCYCEALCNKNDAFCMEFLRRNANLFVLQIELVADEENKKWKPISCTILLCLLNLNMCTLKTTQLMVQNTEIQACSSDVSVADTSANYYYTAETIRSMLQKLISTLSEDDIYTAFNDYLNQIYAMNSKITEDDFCTGKIEPYHEFLLKLCYCEKLCNKMDDEMYKEFLRRNADYLVTQIEEVVHGNKIIEKLASCKILLHLLNWNICNLKPTLHQRKIQNRELKELCSFQSEEENTTKTTCTMYKVRHVLQNLFSTLTYHEISQVFNDYIEQLFVMKSEITPEGLCIGETEPNHEYQLKLCYWTTICRKNDNKAFKKFIQLYPEVLVSDIKKRIVLCQGTKTKRFFCKILLCILNWNICTVKKLLVQNAEIQASSSVVIIDDSPPKYSCTAETVNSILQTLLSTFSEEEIFTTFNNYLDILYAMKSEITEDDFCTGEIEPYHEFQLKLCYYEKLCNKNDETSREFLRKNADLFVSQIESVVKWEKIKWKLISCTILLCLLKFNMCTLKTTKCMVQNTVIQAAPSDASVADKSTKYSDSSKSTWRMLKKIISTLSEDEMFTAFNDYLEQTYTSKSEITEDDFCTGKIEPYYEFLLKLCHCQRLCNKNDETFEEFLRRNADMFVSQIEILVDEMEKKWKPISCTILLCLLKFNMCTLETSPIMVQNTKIQACPSDASVADTLTKYSYTANTLWSLLETLLSTLSEDDIFTTFNNYLNQMYAMKSEITEDDFCTAKLKPYHESLLKLCYCEKLCIKKDENKMKKFLSRNADFLVSQIEEGVNGGKKLLISCKVLLCLSKWGISNQNTAFTSHENILIQTLTFNADYQDFINENALFFLTMVDTVMTKNKITVLINLCDVFLCIPYNDLHFHDITAAVNKLIRYYAKQVGINKKILEWIIKLGYRVLRHLNDNQKLDTAIKIELEFQNLFNLLDDLLTDSNYNSKALESVKSKIYHHGKKLNISTYYPSPYRTEVKYKVFDSHYHSKEVYEQFDSRYHYTMELFETRLRELWIDKIKCKVKATQISNKIRNKGRENLKSMIFLQSNITMSEQDFIYEWEADLKENHLNNKKMEAELKEIKMVDKKVDEIMNKLKLYEMLVLFMMTLIVMVGISNRHHKSAKLKKYLSLKYEYAKASLYLLWCSGDIEVHPGPCMQKKALVHDSSIERRWIQNISPKIINRLSEHEQSKYKPTKKVKNDKENREHFKALLKTCLEKSIPIPKMYLAEINAWETKEYQLLHKLFVYRCEIETIITSLQDFFICGGSTKDLTDINVSLDTELKTNDITTILGKDHRPTDKSQLIVYITRHIAGIAIKCAHGKDPDAKCDGLWDLPLKNWPKDIILFDPNNRGKYSEEKTGKKLIPDQELVDMLLRLPQVTIPQKYKDIIEAFKAMRKSKTKQHKEQLCSTFKRSTSLEKINYALKNLCKNGILTEEIYDILTKWWKTGTVESREDQTQSLENMDDAKKIEQPHILIYIHTKSITFTVEPTSPNSSQVSYDFPVKYELVPLKTMKLLPTPEENPGDYQTDSIIPQETMNILNSIITFDPNSQAMFESDIKLQCKTSTQDTASSSMTHLNQTTSSSFQFSQSNQNIAIYGQPGPILCTHNQLTINSDDLGHLHLSATKDSKNFAFQNLFSPTSDMGSSNSISLVNSEPGNKERDQNNTLNEGQDLTTDSDYSSDSSNNCVSKTSMKKRKCIEEDRIEMKKRKIPSLKQDKKQSDPTNHRKDDSSMDNSNIFNTNMELLQDCLQIDLDSFVFDDQTFDVKLNALDYEDKNPQICDKDRNLMNCETQMSNENTNISAYNTSVSTILEKFVQDMINKEHEKMSQMKTSLSEV